MQELSKAQELEMLLSHLNTVIKLMNEEIASIDADLTELQKKVEQYNARK